MISPYQPSLASQANISSHSVVTTVRSQAKADQIKEIFSGYGSDKLDFVFVKDIAIEGAFDEAVKSTTPFEAVVCSYNVAT